MSQHVAPTSTEYAPIWDRVDYLTLFVFYHAVMWHKKRYSVATSDPASWSIGSRTVTSKENEDRVVLANRAPWLMSVQLAKNGVSCRLLVAQIDDLVARNV